MSAESNTVSTSLANLRQPVADAPAANAVMGFNSHQGFELMQRGAKLLAASTLVPTTYQGNLPNCVIALNMASRLGADPLLVMQNLYVVHGRPAWSAQFLIATFNQCGRFSAIRYKWSGTQGSDDWSCQAYATEKETGETIVGPVISIALAKKEGWYAKSGSKWQSIPQLMLMYRAAAWLVRTHAPELSMGLRTADEEGDIIDAERAGDGTYTVDTEALRQAHPLPAEAAPAAAAEGGSTNRKEPPTIEAAKDRLREAGSLIDLQAAYQALSEDFGGDVPLDVEAFRNIRREELEAAGQPAAGKGGRK